MSKKNTGLINQKTSHENLDTKISIIGSWSWIIWFVILFIFIALFLWSIFGFVRVREHGLGIIVPRPARIFEADAEGNGIVEEVYIRIGSKVEKGHKIAKLKFIDLDNKIQESEIYINTLREQKNKILLQIKDQKSKLGKFTKKYNNAFNIRLENAKKYKKFMSSFIIKEKDLEKEGAISVLNYEKMQNNLFLLENNIAKMLSDMAQFHFNIDKYKYEWEQDIFQINLKLIEAENNLQHYKRDRDAKQYIIAPLTGTITQVFNNPGAYIKEGEVFSTVVMDSDEIDLLSFFPAIEGKRIENGMTAYVSPTIAQKELYGTIRGKVIDIVKYPLSSKDVAILLQDEDLAKMFCKKGAPLMGKIILELDDSTPTGYKWTSKNGPEFPITSGTVCEVDVVVRKRTPITLLIPYLRHFLGVGYE